MIEHVYAKVLLAGGITANTNGSSVDLTDVVEAGSSRMRFRLEVLAASGTSPTLDVAIQESADGSTWSNLVSFTQATGATTEEKFAVPTKRYIRATATVGGTSPSFNAAVVALGTKEYA